MSPAPTNYLAKDAAPLHVAGRRVAWKERLIAVLAAYCGCSYAVERDAGGSVAYYLVGRQQNTSKMRGLWEWLSLRIHAGAMHDARGNGRIVINSYCLGFVEGLENLINDSPSSDLSRANKVEAENYRRLSNSANELASCIGNSNIDEIAFDCGKTKGQMTELFSV